MDSNTTSTLVLSFLAAAILLTGLLMAAMPYLQRRTEVFAVTVPAQAHRLPFVRGLKRRFAMAMSIATVALTAGIAALAVAGNVGASVALAVVGVLALIGLNYALMLRCRRRMSAFKKENAWSASHEETVALIGEESRDFPQGISLAWNWLYVPLVLVTLALGVIGYAGMPEQVPLHVDVAGNVDRWAEKSPLLVALPVIFELFMAVCFTFAHWSMLRSKSWTEPAAPASSTWAYGMFVRAQSIFDVVFGLLLTGVLGVVMMLALLGVVGLDVALVAVLAVSVPLIVGCVALNVVYGQAGSRLVSHLQESDKMPTDDDRFWKAGIFYCNPNDASLFLPARFGMGWTCNFVRPAVWAIIGACVVLTAAFVVVCMALAG